MGMTITQKILAMHSDQKVVKPGDIISVKIDLILGNDASAPLAIKKLEEIGMPKIRAADRTALFPDHFTPPTDETTAESIKILRDFSLKADIKHYFEVGEVGIEHAVLPEIGLIKPGDLIIGADSHTCTYGAIGAFSSGVGSTDFAAAMVTGETWFKVPPTLKIEYIGKPEKWISGKDLILYTIGKIGTDGGLGKTLEFCGEVIGNLEIEDRLTMANMAVEAGAVNGIMKPDTLLRKWLNQRTDDLGHFFESDINASYEEEVQIDVSSVTPQVAMPFNPGNVAPVQEVSGIKLDQVFIGSCTNGHLSDLRTAASILKGNKAAPHVRLLISPATRAIYKQALEEGLIEIFHDANAVLLPSSCGVCFGHIGRLAKGERCLSTSNRNFKGRMGDPESEVFLASPAVAAASAIRGEITHPFMVTR
ncbi:MAG: 3-isopropylmalate dehydratase large subunit [Deltaproteobacteria bacterium]|nr:3-isopropylmalate dehydratase large subunit [Deltaproteobacteria bacterium]